MRNNVDDLATAGERAMAQELEVLRRAHSLSELCMDRVREIVSRGYRRGWTVGYEEAVVKSQDMVNRITSTLDNGRNR